MEINPNLKVHEIYTMNDYVDEKKRVVMTRFRLSSHNLKIKTGRWARIKPEHRLCDCRGVEDEAHVTLFCPKTEDIRKRYQMNTSTNAINNLSELMDQPTQKLVNFIYECMKEYV